MAAALSRSSRTLLMREHATAEERADELAEAAQLLQTAAEKLALAGRHDLAMDALRIASKAERGE